MRLRQIRYSGATTQTARRHKRIDSIYDHRFYGYVRNMNLLKTGFAAYQFK